MFLAKKPSIYLRPVTVTKHWKRVGWRLFDLEIDMQYVYDLIDPSTMRIRYVGKTNNLKKRMIAHCRPGQDKTHRGYWLLSLRERGLKPILANIEEIEGLDRDVFQCEIDRISLYKSRGEDLVNETIGGEGTTGYSLSEEHKQAISKANKGWSPSDAWRKIHSVLSTGRQNRLGMKNSAEQNKKISDANRGRKPSEATRAKLRARTGERNHNFGKPMSEEQKKKIGIANKGKAVSEEHRRKISQANKGKIPAIAGKQHMEETKEKFRAAWERRKNRSVGNAK